VQWDSISVKLGYLTMLSVMRLFNGNDRMVNEYETFDGMSIGSAN
jgi:hypothetical protein